MRSSIFKTRDGILWAGDGGISVAQAGRQQHSQAKTDTVFGIPCFTHGTPKLSNGS
jgi:hypothetical protein